MERIAQLRMKLAIRRPMIAPKPISTHLERRFMFTPPPRPRRAADHDLAATAFRAEVDDSVVSAADCTISLKALAVYAKSLLVDFNLLEQWGDRFKFSCP